MSQEYDIDMGRYSPDPRNHDGLKEVLEKGAYTKSHPIVRPFRRILTLI